ncbi:MAG: hypothetical protein Kow0099_29710 [Candidatus Abyssubacteria bacterium]
MLKTEAHKKTSRIRQPMAFRRAWKLLDMCKTSLTVNPDDGPARQFLPIKICKSRWICQERHLYCLLQEQGGLSQGLELPQHVVPLPHRVAVAVVGLGMCGADMRRSSRVDPH